MELLHLALIQMMLIFILILIFQFLNLENTGITLFALLNGDDIHATFNQLQENYPYPIIAEFYLYSFIMLFITAVLNIFIFIIEDAYHLSKAVNFHIIFSFDSSQKE